MGPHVARWTVGHDLAIRGGDPAGEVHGGKTESQGSRKAMAAKGVSCRAHSCPGRARNRPTGRSSGWRVIDGGPQSQPCRRPAGTFQDHQLIDISVGPSKTFTSGSKVNILECADAGGTTANLPTDDSTCDGNTVQANTAYVKSDGSLSESGYEIFALPDPRLGPSAIKCDAADACVLYLERTRTTSPRPRCSLPHS